MKDYKLSEIMSICDNNMTKLLSCRHCPIKEFCMEEFEHVPKHWKIDDKEQDNYTMVVQSGAQ